jgi:hypothetical protein
MFESRKSGEPEYPVTPFEIAIDDYEGLYSPFPVIVATKESKPLGVGFVIGKVETGDNADPVIEIEDIDAPTGKVHLLGSECVWYPCAQEVADMAKESGMEGIRSAYVYAQRLDKDVQAN